MTRTIKTPKAFSAITSTRIGFTTKANYTQGSATAGISATSQAGFIQTYDSAIATLGSVGFTVSCPSVSASTTVVLTPPINTNTAGTPVLSFSTVTSGSFGVRIQNASAVGTIGTVKFGYALF